MRRLKRSVTSAPSSGRQVEQTEVGVAPGRAGVVVARPQVHVAPDPLPLPAHHQGGLGVGLEAHDAVDDVHPRLLQRLGPLDVVLLVEAGLELQQDGHLLVVLPRPLQRLHDGRVVAHPVEGLLDRQHVRVGGGGLDELDHRGEGVEGVVQEDVPAPDGAEDVLPLRQRRRDAGDEGGVLEVRAIQGQQRGQVGQPQRGRRHLLVRPLGPHLADQQGAQLRPACPRCTRSARRSRRSAPAGSPARR